MSSPHMFNFYEVLAGHDMVTDVGRATTRSRKFKAPLLQTKVQKMKDLPKTAFDQENSLKISKENKNRKIIHDLSTNPVEHK